MKLEDIPHVCIEHSGNYKFVQIEGLKGENYIYGQSKWRSHDAIFTFGFLRELDRHGIDVSNFKCNGGGWIDIDNTQRILTVSDKSLKFGKFDIEIVRSLLEVYVMNNF